ncbi:MAG: FeoB-associated Cys-rich membrane protein [Clostridia bacterium]|nr:FeoB-associated Cys-rich membrane protein [Clostridia bacterium]
MENVIIVVILALILGAAIAYIIKAKKSGKKCIGCPDSCSCGTKKDGTESPSCQGNCSCCGGCDTKK